MLSSSKLLQLPGGDIRPNFVLNSSRLVLVKALQPLLKRAEYTQIQVVFALRKLIAKSKKSIKTTRPTEEDIRSLDSAKTTSGLPESVKQYTNTSMPTATTGTPYPTTEPTGSHIWEKESHKLINMIHNALNTTSHPLVQLKKQPQTKEKKPNT